MSPIVSLTSFEIVHVRVRRDLACHDDESGRDQGLQATRPFRGVSQDGIEHRIRDLVGDLVGWPQ